MVTEVRIVSQIDRKCRRWMKMSQIDRKLLQIDGN